MEFERIWARKHRTPRPLALDVMLVAYERGVRFFVELPPGHTWTHLASTAFPDARSIALSQMQIDSAVKLIKRQAERVE